ncbi:MAG: type II secretion system F family protein [Planctomycetota bacterium]|nr:type II secretion system F family protein [Planctomycetota bacterium]MDP6761565.1 type II secretion system F family protein [Planctomycetota bacterium]MDP6990741.1 type II secretion system F family protein [Planctomycetota bacterium]
MTQFKYAAKGPGGKTVEGTIDATDRNEAVAELRRQNLVVMRVDDQGAGSTRLATNLFQRRRPKAKPAATRVELVLFTRQLATMVNSGLSLLEGLETLGDQAESVGLRATCERLVAEVRAGADLSAAMETCPKAFDALYISMVRAAEVSGQMDVILERLAEYLERAEELRNEIKAAMTYPVVSIVLVTAITAFLMIGVVPGFRDVFDSLDSELPALTAAVLGIAEWMKANWMVMFGSMVGGAVGFSLFRKTEAGQLALDRLSLSAPVFGPLSRKVALARFSRTFATLIRSGVPIMATLDIVADTAGNRVIAGVVQGSRDSVRSGNMLSEPLGESSVFPPMVVKMISIGERSGALEVLLEKIAEFYDGQVKAAVKGLTSMIEPILITVMGVMVGGVVLSVFLPILEVVGNLSPG